MPERAVADPIKILVVGGDPESRHGATRTLDATPGLWVVGVVATAADAVAAVRLVHPDVVLIDVSTTAADTLDAVRRIKAGGHVPGVLLLTTDAAADLRERAAAVGVDGWLARDELGEAALPAIRAAAAGTPAAPSPAGVAQPRSDVTGGMAGGFDETVVFDRITRSAAELIGARVASLWIADDSSHAISVRAWSDSDLGRDWSPATLSEASGGLGAVATHREVQDRADIVADDSFLPAESRQWAVRHGLSSALVVPVVLGGDLLAVLALFSAHPFEFGVDEHELLDRFTALAAVTLATSRAHQEALRDRDFHRSVAEHATEAIIATDAAGRVSYINPRAETMFDCHAERVVGRDIKALAAHGDVDPTIVEAIARHLRNAQEVSQQDLTFSRHSGETLEATMSVRRLPGIRDEPAGFVFVVRDITDIRSTLRSLQQTERLSVMGLLVAGVAHELSNPLQVVAGYADLLKTGTADQPRIAAKADQIHRAATRCSRIVDNFLALARRRPHERQAVRMNAIVQEALDLLAYQLRLDGIDVKADLAADLPEVWGDAHELHQVLVNLITNARHAMRRGAGERQLRLTTRAAAGGTRVVVEVADSGPGVPPALRERIFEPFFTTAPPGEGTGLGLPLCQSIVVAHGGSVALAAPSGAGATFAVELPARPVPPSTEHATTTAAGDIPRQRVLVVDDEPDVGDLVAAFLDVDGHVPRVERDAARALERLREAPVDVVLVDIHMASMDGLEFYRRLQHVAPHLARRVIFMTGDALTPGGFLLEHGLTSLGKPFGRDALRTALRRVLAR